MCFRSILTKISRISLIPLCIIGTNGYCFAGKPEWHLGVRGQVGILKTPYTSVAYYVTKTPRRVLVLASGYPWDDNTASALQLREYVRADVTRWKSFAERNHALILAPAFGSGCFAGYRQLYGEGIRPDDFVNMLIDGPASEIIPDLNGHFSLHGHSAGAQFAARYLVTHPERLEIVILSAPSTYPMPDPTINWPYGERQARFYLPAARNTVCGPSEHIEAKFTPKMSNWLVVAVSVPVIVMVGSKDLEPRPPAPGNRGLTRYDRARQWVLAMNRLAEGANRAATVRLVTVKGIDHDEIGMMEPAHRILEQEWRVQPRKQAGPLRTDLRGSGVATGQRKFLSPSGRESTESKHRRGDCCIRQEF
jgi:pimeloyl-ACP methyl ester carboxylesterase